MYNNVLEDIDQAHADKRLSGDVNHASWIAGHLLSTRHTLASALGIESKEKYGELFAGRKGLDETATYPDINDIKKEWNSLSEKIQPRFAGVTADVLQTPIDRPVPVGDQTVGGLFSFLMSHESYHIGQLSLLRKQMGYGAMSYK